jgi:glycolate oxidase FAD binding subunit
MTAQIINHFQEVINHARSSGGKIAIEGNNTKSWYGDNPTGEPLSTKSYTGIVDYQPEELVITVRSGTLLSEVEEVLAQKNQMFAFEPPHFSSNATIGGMVASGLAGPGRAQAGNLRDFVLGADIMDGTGRVLSFGGKVMKNVAGYDVSRLIPGSMGTLALLLDVSIKVLPKPAASKTLCFELPQAQAIQQMNTWASQPLPVSASAWIGKESQGLLFIRLAGAKAAVEAATSKMQQEIHAAEMTPTQALSFWASLREQEHTFFKRAPGESLWRFAVNPMSPPMELPGETCIEWLGGQRWVKSSMTTIEAHALAAKHGGHATQFRGERIAGTSVFTSLLDNPLTAPLNAVQKQLRAAFDPDGIFQTGRMP